jgi:hypothetical protein
MAGPTSVVAGTPVTISAVYVDNTLEQPAPADPTAVAFCYRLRRVPVQLDYVPDLSGMGVIIRTGTGLYYVTLDTTLLVGTVTGEFASYGAVQATGWPLYINVSAPAVSPVWT